jgi:hypothetical protein
MLARPRFVARPFFAMSGIVLAAVSLGLGWAIRSSLDQEVKAAIWPVTIPEGQFVLFCGPTSELDTFEEARILSRLAPKGMKLQSFARMSDGREVTIYTPKQ